MCTGDYQENAADALRTAYSGQRPSKGTRCVTQCYHEQGRWGSSYCYTKGSFIVTKGENKGKTFPNWGAECVPCSGKQPTHELQKVYKLLRKNITNK